MKKLVYSPSGFTLVELMVTMAITGILVGAIYSAHITQQRTYIAQDQVAEMQQNIRAAMDVMKREIRMAGYDPTHTAGAGITIANTSQFGFSKDITANPTPGAGDGDVADPGELVELGFSSPIDNNNDGIPDTDSDGDGIPDARSLGRQTGGAGGYQPIAENIQAIEFKYLDLSGNVTAVTDDIRTVQVSILARAGQPDREFTNSMTYTTASGANWGPYNDNFRRRLLITSVKCRNMGLQQ